MTKELKQELMEIKEKLKQTKEKLKEELERRDISTDVKNLQDQLQRLQVYLYAHVNGLTSSIVPVAGQVSSLLTEVIQMWDLPHRVTTF